MNTLIRWDPFKEMEDLQSRFAKLFGLTPARTGFRARAEKIPLSLQSMNPTVF